jgi:hypothetical protein
VKLAAHAFMPHQEKAYDYARKRSRVALFMDMRLGKSSVVIRWAKTRQSKRVLLVAPLSTLLGKLNWQGELQREGINPVLLPHVPRSRRMTALRPSRITNGILHRGWVAGWFGVNYEALRAQPEILAAPWDTIILDESTRIRSPRAQTTKLLIRSTDHIANRAILSGLPNPEDPMDYFSQFVFRDGHFMGYDNYWAFRQTFFFTGYTDWDWRPKPKTRELIKQYVHKHAFVMTRKQAGVGSAKVRQQRSVEMNTAQRALLKQMKREFAVDDTETKWVPVIHTWMQRVAGGFHPVTHEMISDAKIRLAEELIVDEFRHEPLVVWFRFNNEIESLHRWLHTRHPKLRCEYIHGAMKDSKRLRSKIQQRFQDGTTDALLIQVKLGKYGWNLSRASTALYYSNTYEFEDRSQSEDRLIHLNKTKDCLYLDLVTLGTPDEDVVDALTNKRITARLFNSQLKAASIKILRAA